MYTSELFERIFEQNQQVLNQNQQVLNQNQQVLDNNTRIVQMLEDHNDEAPSDSSSEYMSSEFSTNSYEYYDDQTVSSSEYVPSEASSSDTATTLTEEIDDESTIAEEPSKPLCYTKQEIRQMNDFDLMSNFVRIKGVTHLNCKHCKKPKPIVGNWVFAIRNRCEKYGLNVNTPLPKTCDSQLSVDKVRNSINNQIYPTLRNPNVSDEVKQRALEWKRKKFAEIGNKIRPQKYVFIIEPEIETHSE